MLQEVKQRKIRLGAVFNGDKESTCAIYIAATFSWDVACLITVSHSDQNTIIPYQAQAMGLPLISEKSSGEKVADFYEAIKKAKERYHITGIIAAYSYESISKICKELQIHLFAPLWQKDQKKLLKEMIESGMDIRISRIAAEPLNEQWLGRTIDIDAYHQLMQLQYRLGFNAAGDSGEYSSVVLFCPHIFQKRIEIKHAEIQMESEYKGVYTLKEVAVV